MPEAPVSTVTVCSPQTSDDWDDVEMNFSTGEMVYSLPKGRDFHLAIARLVDTEEQRVLALRECGMSTEEDMLIHFVRMYILRWAIPAIEIESSGQLGLDAIGKIERRFWLCMLGRALDDLCDRDSVFFSLGDSTTLVACYSTLLDLKPGEGSEVLRRALASLKVKATDDDSSQLSMAQIRDDVCKRVAYFLSARDVDERCASLVRRYVGVLLGRCDLDDCLADGPNGSASTTISRNLHEVIADREGKLHIGADLLHWYRHVHDLLSQEAQLLASDLCEVGASYAGRIVTASLARWDNEIKSLSAQK
jgi:hypothetical protein